MIEEENKKKQEIPYCSTPPKGGTGELRLSFERRSTG
jgi:hypothetical protein